jgi:hypothetical protein
LLAACLALSSTFSAPVLAEGAHAHVHGIARLDVAVDGETLTLALESPLDNVLGFEHLPKNEKEKAQVRAMADKLNQPATLLVPSAAAQCKPVSTKLASPVLDPKGKSADGHADLDGEFVFRCANPAALRDIEVKMFNAFPHLQRLDVQVAAPRGQAAARLTAAQPRISW